MKGFFVFYLKIRLRKDGISIFYQNITTTLLTLHTFDKQVIGILYSPTRPNKSEQPQSGYFYPGSGHFIPTVPSGGYIYTRHSLPVMIAASVAVWDGYACLPLLP